MVDLLTVITAIVGLMLLLWILANSDDDNSGGGLMEPALIPIPVKRQHH